MTMDKKAALTTFDEVRKWIEDEMAKGLNEEAKTWGGVCLLYVRYLKEHIDDLTPPELSAAEAAFAKLRKMTNQRPQLSRS